VDVTASPNGAGRVLAASFLGPVSRITVALGGDTLIVAQAPSVFASELPPGTPVEVAVRHTPVVVEAAAEAPVAAAAD
jgi:putative spermidine/putrescine transport system ATP-binding protein